MNKKLLRQGLLVILISAPLLVLAQNYNALTERPTPDQVQRQRQIQEQGKLDGRAANSQIYQGVLGRGANPYDNNPVPNIRQGSAGPEQYFGPEAKPPVAQGVADQDFCRSNAQDPRCSAVNLFTAPRATFNINARNDPLIRRQQELTTNPISTVNAGASSANPLSVFPGGGGFTGTVEQCRTVTDVKPAQRENFYCEVYNELEFKECDAQRQITLSPEYVYRCLEQRRQVQSGTCSVGRVIEVTGNTRYQCDVSTNSELVTCDRIISATCSTPGGADGCDTGGIKADTVQADMRYAFINNGSGTYMLEFGTFEDNYWRGNPSAFDRNLSFQIVNKSQITQFALVNASYDDWLYVAVNGTLVYNGPNGGDRLEIVTPQNATYTSFNSPDLCYTDDTGAYTCTNADYSTIYGRFATCNYVPVGQAYRYDCTNDAIGGVRYGPGPNDVGQSDFAINRSVNLNIDLRPFLRDGANTIFMRTVVGDKGEGAIRIATRQQCAATCTETVDDQCGPFEARK